MQRGHRDFARALSILVLAAGGLAGTVAAQPASRVADINTSRTGGTDEPTFPATFDTMFVELGDRILMTVNDGIHGTELWRTDGTAAGTELVADICPGACTSQIFWLTTLGSAVFFSADDGIHGGELWRSDGTAAGTRMVADLRPGSVGSRPHHLVVFGGELYFGANDGAHGDELWRSDGTAAGTELFADLEPGPEGSRPQPWTPLGSRLIFDASDAAHGRELWASDGTTAGTSLLKDIYPGSFSGTSFLIRIPGAEYFAVADGRVYFRADDGSNGSELWASDGTAAGTARVRDIATGPGSSSPRNLLAVGSRVYFAASDGIAGSEHGQELWVSDGTEAGTTMVEDINPGPDGSEPWEPVPFAGGVAFRATDGVHGTELWWTDGTAAGTAMVKDIAPGPDSGLHFLLWASPTVVGNRLLFFANDGVHGRELWSSDGTEAGTRLLVDLEPGPGGSGFEGFGFLPDFKLVWRGRWYFRARSAMDGIEVWTSDGTPAGTTKLKEINAQASSFTLLFFGRLRWPRTLEDVGGTLLFGADDGIRGTELWRSDGTTAGTSLVKDVAPGPEGSSPISITAVGGRAFFVPLELLTGDLWTTDGTAAGTSQVEDIAPGFGGSCCRVTDLAGFESRLLFRGDSGGPPGEELWRSEGDAASTGPLRTAGGEASLDPAWLTPFAGRLFYAARGSQGDELWATDGTPAGTGVVDDLVAGPGSSDPQGLAVLGSQLLFTASRPSTGRELWRSDGTAAGTALVTEIRPGAEPGFDRDLPERDLGEVFAVAGPRAFFAGDDRVSGEELWATDGTAGGTGLVEDIRPGSASSEIRELTAAGDLAFFVADDGVHGREPWVSDGTAAGTLLLGDLVPGPGSSQPQHLRAVGGLLLFAADDGVHGLEPWVSDGTPTGTRLVQDVAPGPLPSSAQEFTVSGERVYFVANDGTTGFELWSMTEEDLAALVRADLAMAVEGSPSEVPPGGIVTFRITLENRGPITALDASWTALLPPGLSFLSLEAPDGWSCSTPAVGSSGAVACTRAVFAPAEAVFTLEGRAAPAATVGSTLELSVRAASSTAEGSPGDEAALASTPVVAAPQVVEVPALGDLELLLLALLLAVAGLIRIGRD